VLVLGNWSYVSGISIATAYVLSMPQNGLAESSVCPLPSVQPIMHAAKHSLILHLVIEWDAPVQCTYEA